MADIVLIAHGSPDPRHREGIETLADAVRLRMPARFAVGACFLDHHAPSPREVAAEVDGAVVAVPVLLTPAYHARVDIPQAAETLGSLGASVRLTPALGPDPRLLSACGELLERAGVAPDPDTGVVLFAAGSSDAAAVSSVADTIAQHPVPGWGPWRVAALDGGRAVEHVVEELAGEVEQVVAVSFMVAEGVLRDRMAVRCAAAGVRLVPGALASTAALADLVVARVAQRLAPSRALG